MKIAFAIMFFLILSSCGPKINLGEKAQDLESENAQEGSNNSNNTSESISTSDSASEESSTSNNAGTGRNGTNNVSAGINKCKMPRGGLPVEMGINLSAPQSETSAINNGAFFADLFKSARPFRSYNKEFVKEENGWPCFSKKGQSTRTHILEGAMEGSVPNGIYPLHYKGDVDITLSGQEGQGVELIDCPADESRTTKGLSSDKAKDGSHRKCLKLRIYKNLGPMGIKINIVAKSRRACLEKLKIIMPGGSPNYEEQFEADSNAIVFNEDYINHLKPFRVLRVMNLMYSSPRMPEECRSIQQAAIDADANSYSWNKLSDKAAQCVSDPQYDRTLTNRAKVDDATWGISHLKDKRQWKGVPIEVVAALIKKTGSNPWLTIPHNASASYVKYMAKQFLEVAKFNPALKVHVEYSNEVWNGRFWGAKYITANYRQYAKKRKRPIPGYQGMNRDQLIVLKQKKLKERKDKIAAVKVLGISKEEKELKIKAISEKINNFLKRPNQVIDAINRAEVALYVDRSLEVFNIFKTILKEKHISRTLGTNQKDHGRTRRMLDYLDEKGELDQIDSVATATYFHGCWGGEEGDGPHCEKYLDPKNNPKGKRKSLFNAQNLDDVFSIINDPDNPEGVDAVIKQVENQQEVLKDPKFKWAEIDLVAYEGGQHMTIDNMPGYLKKIVHGNKEEGIPPNPGKKKDLISMIHEANKDPRMGAAYDRLYEGWVRVRGKTHVNFISAQTPSQWGSFGLCPHINACDRANAPKYDSAVKYSKIYCEADKI